MGLTLSNVKNTKIIEDFLVKYVTEIRYPYDDKNPPRHSESG